MRRWSEQTQIPAYRLVAWIGICLSKFHAWRERYGKATVFIPYGAETGKVAGDDIVRGLGDRKSVV